jgi:hypothetical protein
LVAVRHKERENEIRKSNKQAMKALINIINFADRAARMVRHEGGTNDISRRGNTRPLIGQRQLNTMARAYLRDLRAAEMIGWQLSGGDYLSSRWGMQTP